MSLTTVAVLLLAPAGSDADAQDGTVIERDGILYELDDTFTYQRTAEVVGPAEGYEPTHIEIPSRITHEDNEYRVHDIGASAFEGMTGLVSVELPQSVFDIGSRAFAGCTSLSEINIPAGVTELHQTFAGCTSLESVMLTGSYYLTTLSGTFEGCTSLRDLAIRWVADVGDDTFSGCESLVNIDTGHIVRFGDRSFMGCASLERLDVMEGVSEIGDEAFAGCSSLASVDIPGADGLIIGSGAFSGCDSLSSFSVDGDVRSLGDLAFSGCASLSELTFLDDACEVGSDVFLGSGDLAYLHTRSPEVLAQLDLGDGLETLAVGGGITAVEEGTLPALAGLRVLVLEDGVTSVADGAFAASGGLELISIPRSVEDIGDGAFDVRGTCMVAGPGGCLDGSGVADPVYGHLITYDVTGRPDVADRTGYGWARQGDTVVPDPEDVDGCTVSSLVGEVDVSAGFTMPGEDVTVAVTYDDGERVVMFYDRNIMVYYTWVRLGDPVPLPEDPYVPPLEDYVYEFLGWEGLSPGDVVTGSESYNSMYRIVMTGYSGGEMVDGSLVFKDWLDSPLYLTEDTASALLERTAAEGADGVTFSFENYERMWMTLGNDDLELVDGDGLTIYVTRDIRTGVYSVTVEGPDGVTVDVDLHWRSSDRTTAVNEVLGDGATERVDSETVWHDGSKYVRFTADGSGDYETFDTGLETGVKLAIVCVVILAIIAVALVVLYVRSRRRTEA